MKSIVLIRHAKASSYGAEPGDHGRPLAEKGLAQTKILARQMFEAGVQIDLALVSTATRTRQTWAGLSLAAPDGRAKFLEQLYLASVEQIEQFLSKEAKTAQTLAVIGHNPGLAMLAWKFLEAGSAHDAKGERIIRNSYKTAFAAHFDMRTDKPKLLHLFDPRQG